MKSSADVPRPPRRRIYILPNLFTTAALFSGFYAIVQAMGGRFEVAAMAIFVAMVMDGMDGRIARLTQTQSPFGAEYDSLADMVSFGVAPALVMYEWSLGGMGKFGWAASFLYCVTAALRLARFNTNIGTVDKSFFQGLPSPAAAALLAGFIWVATDAGMSGADLHGSAFVLTVFAGTMMVSNVLYWSGKSINLKKSVPFLAVCLFVLGLALISIHPALALFSLCLLYGVSGPLYWCVRWLRRRSRLQQLATRRAQMHAAREHKTESRTEVNTESPSQSAPTQESES